MYRVIYLSDELHKENKGHDTLGNDIILIDKKVEKISNYVKIHYFSGIKKYEIKKIILDKRNLK